MTLFLFFISPRPLKIALGYLWRRHDRVPEVLFF
jgi:hypothetical protein